MSHISTLQVVYDAIFLVIMSLLCLFSLQSGGYGWQYFHCFLYLCHVSTSCILPTLHLHHACMSHLPQFILFVLGAAMRGHLVRTAIFVPHITSVRTICPAAPCEFLLLSFTTSGGMFFMAFSTLKALLPVLATINLNQNLKRSELAASLKQLTMHLI
jgi:hypothetical protein